ncbi:MAG: LamG domain-containing protein, partial [Planctomycetota bacterium]
MNAIYSCKNYFAVLVLLAVLCLVGIADAADPNLISWWKFDEGSGTIAYDSAGDNDGTINGATWTTGKIDGALDLDGSNDYVDVADSASLSFTDPGLTITAWVYLNQDQSGQRAIVRKNNQWQLGINPANNKVRNLINTDGTTGWTAANDESYTINPDTWYFFAFTYNGSVLKHYANGAQLGSDKTVTGNIVDNSNNAGIGSNTGGGSNNVNGMIDDVRIYNRALAAGEIRRLYQEGAGHKAFNPNPADGETLVDLDTVLSWSPGIYAASHDVYFGIDYNKVNDATPNSAEYIDNQDTNSWDPNDLEYENTYFWRIDEVNDPNLWKGDVWRFTTWLKPNLVGWWKFDEGSGTIAYDLAGNNDGTIHGASWTTGLIDGALSFDGNSDYVKVNDSSSMRSLDGSAAEYTISLWVKTTQTGTDSSGPTMFERRDRSPDEWVINIYLNGDNAISILIAIRDGSTYRLKDTLAINDGDWHHITVTRKNTEYVRIYVDGHIRKSGSTNISTSTNQFTTIGVRRTNTGAFTHHFNGTIDDVRVYDRSLSAQEIWQIFKEGLGKKEAFNPQPADGAATVAPNVVLRWSPGIYAVSHDVYFGTNYNDVNNADTTSTVYIGRQDANSWDPCGLALKTTYYWRIDEVNDPNLWKGDVWRFTTWFKPNLTSWWKFDEGSGTTVYDSAGSNHGTIHGAQWTTGQVGGALSFDGNEDYVKVIDPADGSLDFGTGNFTISLWFKTTDAEGELVDKSGGDGGRSKGYFICIGTTHHVDDGEIVLRVSDGGGR